MRHTSIFVLVFGASALLVSTTAHGGLVWEDAFGNPYPTYSSIHNGGFKYDISGPGSYVPPGGNEEEYRNWAGGVYDADWNVTVPPNTVFKLEGNRDRYYWGGTLLAEGSYLLALQSPNANSLSLQGKYSLFYQQVTLAAGTTISGKISFDGLWGDSWAPELDNDTAFVRIASVADDTLASPIYEYKLSRYDFMEVSNDGTPVAINSNADFGWRDWSFTIPTTGTYWFAIGIEDGALNPNANKEYSSFALFDAITTTGGAVVPEPTTWAGLLGLLGTGGLGLFFYRRRRNG